MKSVEQLVERNPKIFETYVLIGFNDHGRRSKKSSQSTSQALKNLDET